MKYSIILVLPILLIGIVNAGTLDNVSGWAWSENIGWISFNCSNDETCGQSDYGVHVQDSGNIIGYAWSENIGWIDFNPSGVYPGLPNYSARLDLETREASGWARALSYGSGWDGWIKLRCYGSECNASDYGVYVDSGNFFDWAWGGDVVGWISFNCSNDGTCGQSDYKVITTFSFDDNPPLVSITGEPSNWINDNAEAVVNCSDEGGCDSASYRIRAYVNNPGSCSTTYNDYEEESPYTVESHSWICGAAKDLSGNLGFSEPVEFKVDKRNPSSAVTSPDNGSWHKDDFTATVMDSDTGGSGLDNSCQYRITDLNTGTSSGVKTRSCGQYSFNVSVGPNDICREDRIAPIGQSTCHVETQSFDKAGNSSGWQSRNFKIDYTTPVIGTVSPLETNQGEEETFQASLTDPLGEVRGCTFYYRKSGSWQWESASFLPIPCQNGESCQAYLNHTFHNYGNYYAKFSCWDAAGNRGWGEDVIITVNEVQGNHAPYIISGPSYTSSPCSVPTIQADCLTYFSVEADDIDGDDLTYRWEIKNSNQELVATYNIREPSHHFDYADVFNIKVIISDGQAETSDQININVNDPTLFVGLSANPFGGKAPLGNVDLRAIVSGTMFGTMNYKFDCTNNGSWDFETTQSIEDYTASDLCNYLEPDTYTAKVLVERGTGSSQDTINIIVTEEGCTPGEEGTCTSPQGCLHTVYCQEDRTWPDCPVDECLIDSTQGCGNCGTQTCTSSCVWGTCLDQGECSTGPDSLDCPCPPSYCDGSDYYEYSDFADCSFSCSCEECEVTIIEDDPRCNQIPLCDYLNVSPSSGIAPLTVQFEASGYDPDGFIDAYQWDFDGDGIWDRTTDTHTTSYNYVNPGVYCAKVRFQDDDGDWSETPGNCPDSCAKQITVNINNPPNAAVSCDPTGCLLPYGQCVGYTGCSFTLINDSTDPDGQDDIIKSKWDIYGWGTVPDLECGYICDFTPSSLSSNTYNVELYVEDNAGASDTTTKSFTILQDAIAEFKCSLDLETDWQECEDITATEGEIVYIKDFSSASEGGGPIVSWDWTFEDGDPAFSYEKDPLVSFQKVDVWSGVITLDIVDSNGRTDTAIHQVNIILPLPEWRETKPR